MILPLFLRCIFTDVDLFSPVGRFTKTVSVNDAQVTLSVDPVPSKLSALRWRFNGRVVKKWNGQSSITITNVRREDGGFYECFIGFGEQAKYDVVTYRLIVRGEIPVSNEAI